MGDRKPSITEQTTRIHRMNSKSRFKSKLFYFDSASESAHDVRE